MSSSDVFDQCSSISPNKKKQPDLKKKKIYYSLGQGLNTDPRTCLATFPHILIIGLKCQRKVGYDSITISSSFTIAKNTFKMVWSKYNMT